MEKKHKKEKNHSMNIMFEALKISVSARSRNSKLIGYLGFLFSFLPIVIAKVLQKLTDSVHELAIGGIGVREPIRLFLILVLLFIISTVFDFLRRFTQRVDSRIYILKYLKRRILKCKCDVKYKYIENYDKFYERVGFVESQAGLEVAECLQSILILLQQVVTFVSIMILLGEVSPLAIIILIVTSIPAGIISYKLNDENYREYTKWMTENNLVLHYYNICSGEDALQEVRHNGIFPYLKGRWRSFADIYCDKKRKLTLKHVGFNSFADFLRSSAYVFVLVLIIIKIFRYPEIGIGTFTLVYSLAGEMQRVTAELLVGTAKMFSKIPYMKEFFYLDSLEREPMPCKEKLEPGDITFDHVSFHYPNSDQEVLKDINVTIHQGEKVAIVGENGSGKTTFINLLCGMFEPQKGTIRMNGRDIREQEGKLKNGISVVFQDFAHYEDTLRTNICVSDKNRRSTDEELMELANRLHTEEVINSQPNGLNEQIGTFNRTARELSGGQWQKVSIMRAAYRNNTNIMILDEPTAALDPMAETQLYRDFKNITGNRTSLLISHRLGITSVVQRILVFKEGRLIEEGTHEGLMKKKGYYATLYQAQAQWYQTN